MDFMELTNSGINWRLDSDNQLNGSHMADEGIYFGFHNENNFVSNVFLKKYQVDMNRFEQGYAASIGLFL